MTKALIFDCFGVLVKSSLEPFIDRHFANDPDGVLEMRRLDNLANRGEITWQVFQTSVATLTGLTEKQVWDELDDNPPNLELFGYIRDNLKGHYKLGFLSNASDNWMDDLFTKDQQALFDDVILSYAVGLAKPDKEIFELAAKRLGVDPSECVFIDDIERYCVGAREVGMQALQYMDFGEFVAKCEALLR